MSNNRGAVRTRIVRARNERRLMRELRTASPSVRMDLIEAVRRSGW